MLGEFHSPATSFRSSSSYRSGYSVPAPILAPVRVFNSLMSSYPCFGPSASRSRTKRSRKLFTILSVTTLLKIPPNISKYDILVSRYKPHLNLSDKGLNKAERSRLKTPKPSYLGLQCTECQRLFQDRTPLSRCEKCQGLLDTVLDEDALSHYSKHDLGNTTHSMWKFHMFLPVRVGTIPVTAGEGGTPLRPIRSYPRSRNILVKDETRNPTGTFKDRGASLAVTRLPQLSVRKLALASEGNAGCSFALYSQMPGSR